jgi:hypothetical protein
MMAHGDAAAVPLAVSGAAAPLSTQLSYSRQRPAQEDQEYMNVRSSDEDDLGIDADDDENDYDYDGPVAVERLATASNDVPIGTAASAALPSSQGSLLAEVAASAELVFFHSRLNVLMLGGVVAVVGDTTGLLGEPICFCLSGLALIPCAER